MNRGKIKPLIMDDDDIINQLNLKIKTLTNENNDLKSHILCLEKELVLLKKNLLNRISTSTGN